MSLEVPENPTLPPRGMRMMQVSEDDLATLEQDIPIIADMAQNPHADCSNEMKSRIRRVQGILIKIRWNYLPYDSVEIIPAG